jgi:hypothetical protein
MTSEGTQLVAGLFTSRSRADAAVQKLHRIGLTDADIEIGAPEPGRYGIEYDESLELGRGVVMGIAIGVPVGSIVAIAALMLVAPSLSIGASIGLGILIGGFWGIFFGGLGGMVPKVLGQPESTYPINETSSEVVVVAHVGTQVNAARKAIQGAGVRYLLTDVPVVRSTDLVLAAAR